MLRTLATRLFDWLALWLASRSARRTSDPQSAKISARLSYPPNDGPRTTGHNVGTLLFLASFGVVAMAIVVVFFGFGFFLLSHPKEQLIAAPGAGDRGVAVEAQGADFVPPSDKDAAPFTVQADLPDPARATSPAVTPAQSPEARQALPPTGGGTAWDALSASTNGTTTPTETFDNSSRRQLQGSRSYTEATLARPPGITYAKRTGGGRHPHNGARQRSAGVLRPGSRGLRPPSVNAPERAWHWIVQSATSVLAALSPPPAPQVPRLKTR